MSEQRPEHPMTDVPEVTSAELEASGGVIPEGLLEAVRDYEHALLANDVAVLDSFFEDSATSIRSDAQGTLVGHERIAAFRAARGGIRPRRLTALHVRALTPDVALVVTTSVPAAGGLGTQTQLWRRTSGAWRMSAAHVTTSSAAIDRSIWRVVGSPLVLGAATGPLVGHTVAVKDLFALSVARIGAGNPVFLAEAPFQQVTAPAVQFLLDAGAAVLGIAQTDEFAYSIAGRNAHYGTPPNGAAAGVIPGGSSSGPASAVALGQADIGLGSDTAGSVRVPASYQGLWGLRTTHGAVPLSRVLPLAPSFDTVGWLTREAEVLRRAAAASLTGEPEVALPERPRILVSAGLTALAEPEVRQAFAGIVARLVASGSIDEPEELDLGDVAEYGALFRAVQPVEAWESHGAWVSRHWDALGPDVRERFEIARDADPAAADAARERIRQLRGILAEQLGGAVLLLPAAASTAPSLGAAADELQRIRVATLSMTAVAGVGGLPGLSAPFARIEGAPIGLGLVGARSTDLALIDLAAGWADSLG